MLAISTPGGAKSSKSVGLASGAWAGTTDSRMLSARVSNSNADSPALKTRRIFLKARQGVEYLAAISTAHLTARDAQDIRRHLEDGLAF